MRAVSTVSNRKCSRLAGVPGLLSRIGICLKTDKTSEGGAKTTKEDQLSNVI